MATDLATAVPAWALVREARARAGLTQAELAARAGTSQAAVARYERADVLPSLETLDRLVRACGLELRFQLVMHEVDDQLERRLAMTVDDRLRDNDALTQLLTEFQHG
jgi:transcriptional regulator with XRE-family HTH domain